MEPFYHKVFFACDNSFQLYYTITTCLSDKPPARPCPCDEVEKDHRYQYPERYSKEELENFVPCKLRFMGYRSYSATDDILEDTTAGYLAGWGIVLIDSKRLDGCEIIGNNPLIAIKSAKK